MTKDESALDFIAPRSLQDLASMLAISGRLSRSAYQSPSAEEILATIRGRREAKIKAKELRRKKPLPELPNDLPFRLPSGWKWIRLGDVCYEVADGPHFSPKWVPSSHPDAVPMLSAGELSSGHIDLSNTKHVSREDHEFFCKRIRPQRGDLLYTKGGTTGVAVVNDLEIDFSVWVHVAVLRTDLELVDPEYLALALNSPLCYEQAQEYTHGTGNRDLGLTRMVLILLPLPPVEVQRTIVRDFGVVRGYCEALAREEAATVAAGEEARASCLHALVEDSEWGRVRDNWDSLFTTPESVDDLRRAILDLAVRGRLVEQREEEESAVTLIAEWLKGSPTRTLDGQRRKYTGLGEAVIAPPHEAPRSWVWCRLKDLLVDDLGGGTPSKTNPNFWNGPIPWASVKDLGPEKVLQTTVDSITQAGLDSSAANLVPRGSLIVCMRMGLGKINVAGIDVAINQDLRALQLAPLFDTDFAYLVLRTQQFLGSGMTVKGIKRAELLESPICLPPLAEQHRIVAKVDELMALCDELEARLREVEAISGQLAESVVHHVSA